VDLFLFLLNRSFRTVLFGADAQVLEAGDEIEDGVLFANQRRARRIFIEKVTGITDVFPADKTMSGGRGVVGGAKKLAAGVDVLSGWEAKVGVGSGAGDGGCVRQIAMKQAIAWRKGFAINDPMVEDKGMLKSERDGIKGAADIWSVSARLYACLFLCVRGQEQTKDVVTITFKVNVSKRAVVRREGKKEGEEKQRLQAFIPQNKHGKQRPSAEQQPRMSIHRGFRRKCWKNRQYWGPLHHHPTLSTKILPMPWQGTDETTLNSNSALWLICIRRCLQSCRFKMPTPDHEILEDALHMRTKRHQEEGSRKKRRPTRIITPAHGLYRIHHSSESW